MPENNPLVGAWTLISCDAVRNGGTPIPIYGKAPVGRLFYDAAGNMSVHIMKPGRPRCNSDTKSGASDEEMKAAFQGYEAYFATYTLDTLKQTIHHKVVGSLFPNWTGTLQMRYYVCESPSRLLLSTAPIGSRPADRTIVQLVWERLG